MGIVFDEVVGNVAAGDGAARAAAERDEDAERGEAELDPERLRRELRVLHQREARLRAD
ncbi:hypothetical protein [Sorangium sp. So ce388]|uniref:hypothetical protein n=1 Tax=Sorangium sp. So ce388 TaxID=3133309 RepID=UPI003F5B1E13